MTGAWRALAVFASLLALTQAFSKYGRTCRDIGCRSSEVCILAEDPCSYGHTSECGTYPTCKKKSAAEGGGATHSEPARPVQPAAPRPVAPSQPDDVPNYAPPPPPRYPTNTGGGGYPTGGNTYEGGSYNPGGGSSYPGGGSNYPGGGSNYPSGGNTYGGGSYNPGGGSNYPGGGSNYPGGGNSYPSGGNTYGGGSYNPSGGSNYPAGGSNYPGSYPSSNGNKKPGKSTVTSIVGSLFDSFLNKNKQGSGTSTGAVDTITGFVSNVLSKYNNGGGISSILNPSLTRPGLIENPNYGKNNNPQYNQPPPNSRQNGRNAATTTRRTPTYGWTMGLTLVYLLVLGAVTRHYV